MATRVIRYRDHQLVVHLPDRPGDGWRVLIWPPGKDPPTVMPTHATEENAIQSARNAVDRQLGGAAAGRDPLGVVAQPVTGGMAH